MGKEQLRTRRIVPPTVFVTATPPASTPAPAPVGMVAAPPRKRRRRKPLTLILSIIVALLVVGGVPYLLINNARSSAVDRLRNGIKLAHTDSLKAGTWPGVLRSGDTYYN